MNKITQFITTYITQPISNFFSWIIECISGGSPKAKSAARIEVSAPPLNTRSTDSGRYPTKINYQTSQKLCKAGFKQHKYAQSENDTQAKKRRNISAHNQVLCKNGGYSIQTQQNGDFKEIKISPATHQLQIARMYYPTDLNIKYPIQLDNACEFSVVNEDCLDVALNAKKQGYNPVTVNNADAGLVGGGTETGKGCAQEESICLRTNLLPALKEVASVNLMTVGGFSENHLSKEQILLENAYAKAGNYLPMYGGVYHSNVQVFRKNFNEELEFMDEAQAIAVYTIAAPMHQDYLDTLAPNHERRKRAEIAIDPSLKNEAKYNEFIKHKIRACLDAAKNNGHDVVVAGALGCGVFKNNPTTVARLFQEVLSEPDPFNSQNFRYHGCFKKVIFAIKADPQSPIFTAFQSAFSQRAHEN